MADRLVRNWWALGARGAAAGLFGVAMVALPGVTVDAFVALFAVYAMVEGVLTLFTVVRFRSRGRDAVGARDLLFDEAAAGIGLGVLALAWPEVTMQALLALVALWGAVTGGLRLALARRAWRRLPSVTLLAGSGVAGLALGVVLVAALMAGVVRVGYTIGGYGLVEGALFGLLALRLRPARERDGASATAEEIEAPAAVAAPIVDHDAIGATR